MSVLAPVLLCVTVAMVALFFFGLPPFGGQR